MATLRAHGSIVATVSKELPLSTCVCEQTMALMSDNVVLERNIFRSPDGSRNNGGWKKVGPLRDGISPVQWIEFKSKQGWKSCK